MRGKIIELTQEQIVQRALAQRGRPVLYRLKYPNGGEDPEAAGPEAMYEGQRVADCMAVAAHSAGFDRAQHGKFPPTPSVSSGSINTDSMIDEAKLHGKWFTIKKEPELGDFLVTHTFWKKLPIPRRVIGHIGVITGYGYKLSPQEAYVARGLAGLQVTHCSPYNYQFTGKKSAIWTTSGSLWGGYPQHYFIRFNRDYARSLSNG
jgi:hypothetical protein